MAYDFLLEDKKGHKYIPTPKLLERTDLRPVYINQPTTEEVEQSVLNTEEAQTKADLKTVITKSKK